MSILVDEAIWPWRGSTWCHLVSDSDYDELHEFARRLGCRRVGFQGDHYDIDVGTRVEAISLGAEECTSRDLLRRLKAAGLRLAPATFEKWQLVRRWSAPTAGPLALVSEVFGSSISGRYRKFAPPELEALGAPIDGAFALKRQRASALVLHGNSAGPPVDERAELGIYSRVGSDGRWAVELVDPALASSE